jgi:hypothetical protein
MKYRILAVAPFLMTAAFAIVALATIGHPAHAIILRGENEALKVLATLGCLAAALAFERGEYMRRAWGLHSLCFGLLLARDVLYLAGVGPTWLHGVIVLVANAASVVGVFLMARAASEAGLELPGSPMKRALVFTGAALISIAICANALIADTRDLMNGSSFAIVGAASDIGDIVSLALIAPVVLTAMAMRGGVLRWPWGLFAASLVFWLIYDAARAFFSSTIESVNLGVEIFRALACTFTFSAGIAQRFVVSPDGAKE